LHELPQRRRQGSYRFSKLAITPLVLVVKTPLDISCAHGFQLET